MKHFSKDSLLAALFNFRQELKDVELSESQRVKLLEQFKDAFSRSYDYDLAFEDVAPRLMSMASNSKKKSAFKEMWKDSASTEKGLFGWLQNKVNLSESYKLREVVDEQFKSGKTDSEILEEWTNEGMSQMGRPLTPKERDIIRMIVYDEKVKMRERGVIKSIDSFLQKHGGF